MVTKSRSSRRLLTKGDNFTLRREVKRNPKECLGDGAVNQRKFYLPGLLLAEEALNHESVAELRRQRCPEVTAWIQHLHTLPLRI